MNAKLHVAPILVAYFNAWARIMVGKPSDHGNERECEALAQMNKQSGAENADKICNE
jgi:hypothetical protein